MPPRLSVVVPFYNEEAVVGEFVRELRAALDPVGIPWELIAVDDGSADGTLARLRAAQAAGPGLRIVKLSRNFGHQRALTAGLDHAQGDAVVTMDGDLQDPPAVIPDLLRQWEAGAKVVYAVRRRREGEPAWKAFASRAAYRIIHAITRIRIPVDAGDFRLLDRRVVEELGKLREQNRYVRGLTAWVGFRQEAVEYDRPARRAGRSKYSILDLVNLAWSGMAGFSQAPLRLATVLGLLIATGGFLLGAALVLGRLLFDIAPQGWTSTVVIVLFLGGVQLLVVGVLGEYTGRVFEEVKGRPLYVVDEVWEPGEGKGK